MPGQCEKRQRFPLLAALGLYTVSFVVLAWPWLCGRVAIPYDAKSTFYPPLVFLARSLATGQSPFWTPNVFAGWPLIADPQSLIFSPLHFIVALLDPSPSPWLADMLVFALLYAGGMGVMFFFRDRGWHMGGALAAALALSFGGSAASRIQHVGEVQSLVFMVLALWPLSRALERCSVLAGVGTGIFAALMVLGRDQISLIGCYVLAGFVFWHWFAGADWRNRMVASVRPLAAAAAVGVSIVAVPVTLTALLAAISNRPEIDFEFAGRGSLHPANLLMLAFADVFGASDFHREFWGPPSSPWHAALGDTGLFNAQNDGQIYCGALAIVAVLGIGLLRGQLWTRDIRFFTVAAVLTLLYALGWYTPVFRSMYDLLPGVALYRRPADATFVFCALIAIIAGYLVHRWLIDAVAPGWRWQRTLEIVVACALIAVSVWLALRVGELASAGPPILWGSGFAAGAILVLALARRLNRRSTLGAAALLAALCVFDFAFNNAPNESTGLPPTLYAALAPDSKDETIVLLQDRLRAVAAPNRRDRVELIGVGYHWPNVGLIHDFDHLFGHNPLRLDNFERATDAADTVAIAEQRQFTPLLPSYRSVLEDLFGVRFIATGVPIEQVDSALKPGDLKFIARTEDAYVYENTRALPRVMLAADWRKADFGEMLRAGGWPDVDPRRTVLLEEAPVGFTPGSKPAGATGGSARILYYRNTEIEIAADAPAGGILVLNDVWHPWWRASVDGKPAKILQANVLFRAVVVPPGRHLVRFNFHPFGGALAQIRELTSGRRR
jgi:hypothetical protein